MVSSIDGCPGALYFTTGHGQPTRNTTVVVAADVVYVAAAKRNAGKRD